MNRNSPSVSHETKMEPILSYPYNAFLMVRLEFVQILQDDLQSKLLRIIEAHIETQRMVLYREAVNRQKGNSIQPISIPKDIYVPISYKLFMNDLFDLVTSENTIKKALNQMINCRIIFRKEAPKKRYAAPEYSINTTVLQILLNVLKNPGYQTLIPSIIDALKNSYPQELTPSGYQTLISSILKSSSEGQSRVSNFDTNIRESNITDKNECAPDEKSSQEETLTPSSTHSSLSSVSSSQENQHTQDGLIQSTPKEEKPSSEITRVKSYWKQMGYREEKSAAWAELAEKTKTFEEFKSLFDFTEEQLSKNPKFDNKGVHPGNMLNYSNEWVQAEKRKKKQEQPAAQPQESKAMKIKDMTMRPLSSFARR